MWWDHHLSVLVGLLALVLCVNGQNNYQGGPYYAGQPDKECCEEYCYSMDRDPYIYFGTKTSYTAINNNPNPHDRVEECTPVEVWSLIRRGTSYPGEDEIRNLQSLLSLRDRIRENYENLRSYPTEGKLCKDDYGLFQNWNNTLQYIRIDKIDSLTNEGLEDVSQLARRFRTKYQQLFQNSIDGNSYQLQYENVDKIQQTYQTFIDALFRNEAPKVRATIANDQMWTKSSTEKKENVQDQNTAYRYEYEAFLSSPDYTKMIYEVSRRLGFKTNLTMTEIKNIYDLCRYEKSWRLDRKSTWCAAFTKTHMKLLEYSEDLKYYFSSGYGNKSSEDVGIHFVKDLYEKFERRIDGDTSGKKGTFYFADDHTLLNVITALGIAKDDAPLPTDENKRNWRTSQLSPFTGNIQAALYDCSNDQKYKVMFLVNEKPAVLPFCRVGLCDWTAVKQAYRDKVMGNPSQAPALSLNHILYILSAATLVYLRV